MGYTTLPINDPYKQLIVEAHPNEEIFKPGEVVKVTLNAMPRTPTVKQEPVEYAVAVLDESVLDLVKEESRYLIRMKASIDLDGWI